MIRTAVIVAVLTAFSIADSAPAKVRTAQTVQYEQWLDDSLMPPTPEDVNLTFDGCKTQTGTFSCFIPGPGPRLDTIVLSPDTVDSQPVFLHEYGHAFDHQVMRYHKRLRNKFKVYAEHKRSQPWDLTMQELFASAYSLCARYAVLPTPFPPTQYGGHPSQRLHNKVCKLVWDAS